MYCCIWCSAQLSFTVLNTICNNTQPMYSWRWAYRCPKHVELFKIINIFVHQVGISHHFIFWLWTYQLPVHDVAIFILSQYILFHFFKHHILKAYQRGGKLPCTCIWSKPFLFCYKEKPTLDYLIVTLKFAVAETQLIVLITFTGAGTLLMVLITFTIAETH